MVLNFVASFPVRTAERHGRMCRESELQYRFLAQYFRHLGDRKRMVDARNGAKKCRAVYLQIENEFRLGNGYFR